MDDYPQEKESITEKEWHDKEMNDYEADYQMTSQQEDAYNNIFSAVRQGFRAGIDLKDIIRAVNDALPWKIQ